VMASDGPGAELVLEVTSLVGGLLVHGRNPAGCLRPPLRTLPASRDLALRPPEPPLRLVEELRGGHWGRVVAERRVVGQADIDADGTSRVGHRHRDVGQLELDRKADVPVAIGTTAERRALGRLGDLSALADANDPDLRDGHRAIDQLDPLGDAEPGPIPLPAL